MRIFITLLFLFSITTIPVQAATLQENFAAAQAAFKAGDFPTASELFIKVGDELKKKDPAKAAAFYGNAAVCALKAEDYAIAAAIYEKILADAKKLPQDQLLKFYKNLIQCRAKTGERALQISAAERMFKALPKMPPSEASDAYAQLGDAYRHMELYGPAAKNYEKAAFLLPKDADAETRAKLLMALGTCQSIIGDFNSALKNLGEARKVAENVPVSKAEADSNLGILRWERGEYPEAMQLLNAALDTERQEKLRPHEGRDLNNLGLVHKSTGNHEKAFELIEKSLAIAKETGDIRDQGIAIRNRAMLYRLAGKYNEARNDYKEATKLFEQCGFKEGVAGANIGTGLMAMLADKNYNEALDHFLKALQIYETISMPRFQAEALVNLGELYKRIAAPGRSTRDMVFDDEPTSPDISKEEAMAKSREYAEQALQIAEKIEAREMIWAAHQLLGFADYRAGNLESALAHYQKAIDIVTKMFLTLEEVEMLGEYMAGKEDLYREAQEVAAALYDKTKDKKYQNLLVQYGQTLENEIQKASSALVQMNFENKDKQKAYEKLMALGKAQAKAAKNTVIIKELPANPTPEQKETHKLATAAAKEQKAVLQKLEGDYTKLLAEWKKKYPKDAVIFESSAERLNIPAIQKNLKPNQAVIQYITLPDQLLTTVIRKDKTESFSQNIKESDLINLVKKGFIVEYVYNGFKNDHQSKTPTPGIDRPGGYEKYFEKGIKVLHDLYSILIKPVEPALAGIDRLYIVSNGYLSVFPFAALVMDVKDNVPDFLVEKYEIGNIRLAFADALSRPVAKGKVKKMLAVANPNNANFPMDLLDGTIDEIERANKLLHDKQDQKLIAMEALAQDENESEPHSITSKLHEQFPELPSPPDRPTETWLREQLEKYPYEMIYFATHGQAQSDTYSKIMVGIDRVKEKGKELVDKQKRMKAMLEGNLKAKTPLNGFIYLSSEEKDDILKDANIPTERDGCLTIQEILSFDDKTLANTKYVILSVCNSAVTFVPYAVGTGFDEEASDEKKQVFDIKEMEQALDKQGLKPGVDQATFVESFMRRGIADVFATYWQADDDAAAQIMPVFLEGIVKQGENPDLVAAYTNAQRAFIAKAKEQTKSDVVTFRKNGFINLHPYLWAVGAIFGK